MKVNQSISQSSLRMQAYNNILKQLADFFHEDPQKLVHYLHYEKKVTIEDIGRILGIAGQTVRDKYLKEKSIK